MRREFSILISNEIILKQNFVARNKIIVLVGFNTGGFLVFVFGYRVIFWFTVVCFIAFFNFSCILRFIESLIDGFVYFIICPLTDFILRFLFDLIQELRMRMVGE